MDRTVERAGSMDHGSSAPLQHAEMTPSARGIASRLARRQPGWGGHDPGSLASNHMKHDTRRGDDLDFAICSTPDRDTRDSRRVSGIAVRELSCNMGRVVDVSTRGMRLQSRRKWKTGQRRMVTLCEDTLCVRVEAECVWCRKVGALKHTVGLAFTTVSPESAELLSQIVSRQSKADALRLAA